MNTPERVRNQVKEIIGDAVTTLLHGRYNITEPGDVVDEAMAPAVERIATVAQVHYGVPDGIVEVRASLKGYAVDGDDEKAIVAKLGLMNCQDNRVALAIIGDNTVTIRALQADVEAKLRKDAAKKEADDHPGQMDITEVTPELAAGCAACEGSGVVKFLTGPEGEVDEVTCGACAGTGVASIEQLSEMLVDAVHAAAVEIITDNQEKLDELDTVARIRAEVEAETHGVDMKDDVNFDEDEDFDDPAWEQKPKNGETHYVPVDEPVVAPPTLAGKRGKGKRATVNA